MKKKIFGFSAAALVAAAIALPATGGGRHDDAPLARQPGNTIDSNDGGAYRGGEALVLSFVTTVSKSSPTLN